MVDIPVDQDFFSLGRSDQRPVHALRRTHGGIQYLKQTGRFREYMEQYSASKSKPFIAWDGEGWTDDQGYHQYMLLQSSTGANIHSPRLSSIECLELLLKTAMENPGSIHVGFAFGYDTAWILGDMPLKLRLQLRDNDEVVWSVQPTETTARNRYTIR